MDNIITLMTKLKDNNLSFDDPMVTQLPNNVWTINLKVTYQKRCPVCGKIMKKNGWRRPALYKSLSVAGSETIVSIKKQQFICHHSEQHQETVTALAEVKGIEKGERITQPTKQQINLELASTESQKEIAERNNVSVNTVERQLRKFGKESKARKNWLPKIVSIDDFDAGKCAEGKMSIAFMDTVNHKMIDIIESRQIRFLRNYFLSHFTFKARCAVKVVTCDYYQPYRKLVKEIFPNAVVASDPFHTIAQAYRALQKVRIKVMNQHKGRPEYRQLKAFWKLLLKKAGTLNYMDYRPRKNFRYSMLSDSEVIERLLSISDELRAAYNYYQDLCSALEYKSVAQLNDLLSRKLTSLPYQCQRVQRTLRNHKQEIINSFRYGVSNGPLEGMNNKIKVIKRNGYGFRSFLNARLRILITLKAYFEVKVVQQTKKDQAKIA